MKPSSAALIILGLALGLLAPSLATAQSQSPEARELASMTLLSGTFDNLSTQAGKMGTVNVKAALEGNLGRQLTEDESRRLNELFVRLFKETFSQSDYEAHLADVFGRYYAPQELKELVAFFRTPLGMKALRFSSVLDEESSAWAQRLIASRQRQLAERFNAEFAREFPALYQELERRRRR